MVRDGSSGKDDKLPREPDGHAANPDGQFAQDVPTQLTQELARLLAVSIAQSQAGKGFPGGVPTGSELASLASLVSAAAGQRALAPVFRDGLSALAYGPPHGKPAPVLDPVAPEPPLDDEPMPIPSTWRQPASHDEDRWFRQQLGATLLGLFAGLMIVVPAVLWLSGWIGGPQRAKPTTSTGPTTASMDARPPERKVEPKAQTRSVDSAAAAQYVTGSVDPRGSIEVRKHEPASPPIPAAAPLSQPAPTAAPAPKADEQRPPRMDELIAQAMRRAEGGDVTGAREMLAAAEGGAQGGSVTFALAETYDPNKLAAWGTRGVAADAVKARALYTKALNLGVSRAKERLDALK